MALKNIMDLFKPFLVRALAGSPLASTTLASPLDPLIQVTQSIKQLRHITEHNRFNGMHFDFNNNTVPDKEDFILQNY